MLGWVEKPSPVFPLMTESTISTDPLRSLLTKKIALPPSPLERLRSIRVPSDAQASSCCRRCRWRRRCPRPACPLRRVGAVADRAIVGENRLLMIVHETPMLLMPPPFEQGCAGRRAAERAVHDVHRSSLVLGEDVDCGAADVGPGRRTALPKKRELTTLKRPPRTKMAPPPSMRLGPGGAAATEREVLHRQRGVVLVLAVRGGPDQLRVARVHVEDAPRAAAPRA